MKKWINKWSISAVLLLGIVVIGCLIFWFQKSKIDYSKEYIEQVTAYHQTDQTEAVSAPGFDSLQTPNQNADAIFRQKYPKGFAGKITELTPYYTKGMNANHETENWCFTLLSIKISRAYCGNYETGDLVHVIYPGDIDTTEGNLFTVGDEGVFIPGSSPTDITFDDTKEEVHSEGTLLFTGVRYGLYKDSPDLKKVKTWSQLEKYWLKEKWTTIEEREVCFQTEYLTNRLS